VQRQPYEWFVHASMRRHVGLRLSCSVDTRMLPPGVFPRLQMTLAQRLSTPSHPVSVWKDSVWCSNGRAEVMVSLSQDTRSVYAHARCLEGEHVSGLELLADVCDAMVVVLQKSVGVRLSVSYCRNDQLEQYAAEPGVYTLDGILDARAKGFKMIGGGKSGPSEKLVAVLGLPEGGGSFFRLLQKIATNFLESLPL
jgi:hypothetical protein